MSLLRAHLIIRKQGDFLSIPSVHLSVHPPRGLNLPQEGLVHALRCMILSQTGLGHTQGGLSQVLGGPIQALGGLS